MTEASRTFNRRQLLGVIASGTVVLATGARAEPRPHLVVFRNPGCGCCHKWADHLTANGFDVTVQDEPNLKAVRDRLGVPTALAGCHTGQVGGYVVEGHVPAAAIKQLLAEKPNALGLAVSGMPAGSPGMEGGEPEIYDVILFSASEQRSYGRYREDKAV